MKGAHHMGYRLLSGNQNDFILKFSQKKKTMFGLMFGLHSKTRPNIKLIVRLVDQRTVCPLVRPL